mgnify:CR=1 FL=1
MLTFIKKLFKHNRTKNQEVGTLGDSAKRSNVQSNVSLKGDVVFTGMLKIDGTVIGDINSIGSEPSTLIIERNAIVKGNINCQTLTLYGIVYGNVVANSISIENQSHIVGNCFYNSIEVHVGAKISGSLLLKSSFTQKNVGEALDSDVKKSFVGSDPSDTVSDDKNKIPRVEKMQFLNDRATLIQ